MASSEELRRSHLLALMHSPGALDVLKSTGVTPNDHTSRCEMPSQQRELSVRASDKLHLCQVHCQIKF
jgi:hypothetical protein